MASRRRRSSVTVKIPRQSGLRKTSVSSAFSRAHGYFARIIPSLSEKCLACLPLKIPRCLITDVLWRSLRHLSLVIFQHAYEFTGINNLADTPHNALTTRRSEDSVISANL